MRRNRDFIGPAGMGGMVSLWGASSLIQSIQYGTVSVSGTTSGTATITAVDTADSMLVFMGQSCTDTTSFFERGNVGLSLTNSTTVTATKAGSNSNIVAGFCVVEFYPGVVKSVQRGSRAGFNATSTITEVNTGKVWVMHLGYVGVVGNTYFPEYDAVRCELTNSTTLTMKNSNAGGATFFYWQVVEFF